MVKWVVAGSVAFILLVGVLSGISVSNNEIDLRAQFMAQVDANKVTYDKVWKTVSQKAQITDKYKDDFKDVYVSMMNERYEGETKGSPMFKWVQEHNPQLSASIYTDLMDAVESNRAEFLRVQKRLIDIKREHQILRQKFPSSIIVGSRPELVLELVTSAKTKKAFETGEENDVDLFKK